jgi:hypothetical protein
MDEKHTERLNDIYCITGCDSGWAVHCDWKSSHELNECLNLAYAFIRPGKMHSTHACGTLNNLLPGPELVLEKGQVRVWY